MQPVVIFFNLESSVVKGIELLEICVVVVFLWQRKRAVITRPNSQTLDNLRFSAFLITIRFAPI